MTELAILLGLWFVCACLLGLLVARCLEDDAPEVPLPSNIVDFQRRRESSATLTRRRL